MWDTDNTSQLGRRCGRAVPVVALAILLALIWAVPSDAYGSGTTDVRRHATRRPEPIPPRLLAGTGAKKGRLATGDAVVGIASFNVFGPGSLENKVTDLRALTDDPRVDVIGLQETRDHQGRALMKSVVGPEWSYAQDWSQDNGSEVAVVWRTSRFDVVSARSVRGCRSIEDLARIRSQRGYSNKDNRSAPARFTAVVVLRDRATGRTVEVINAHTDQHGEFYRGPRAGHPRENANAQGLKAHLAQLRRLILASSADYTALTGDLNVGYVADERVRSPRFPSAVLRPVAVSSYVSLGLRGQKPSLTKSSRFVDYVYLARTSRAVFLKQSLLDGFHSDHRPLLVQVALR